MEHCAPVVDQYGRRDRNGAVRVFFNVVRFERAHMVSGWVRIPDTVLTFAILAFFEKKLAFLIGLNTISFHRLSTVGGSMILPSSSH